MAESYRSALGAGMSPDQLANLTSRQIYLIENPTAIRRLMSDGKSTATAPITLNTEAQARAVMEKWKADRTKAKASPTR